MNPIGGYFELELPNFSEYHRNAIRLNTGRNALEYILRVREYKRIFIPYFTCDVLLQPIRKLGLQFEFYRIDDNLEAMFNFEKLKAEDVFLYTNYFGLKSDYITKLINQTANIILDYSQSFFTMPVEGIDTFYSPRKFFGVPDGGYLYCDKDMTDQLEVDTSIYRIKHLIERIDIGAEEGYSSFRANDKKLDNLPIREMSVFTRRMLKAIDYEAIASKRRRNFDLLNKKLGRLNNLSINLNGAPVPMVYPLVTDKKGLREKLIRSKIFVATYWPNVLEWANEEGSVEMKLTKQLLPLPIDQRYSETDLERIINIIYG